MKANISFLYKPFDLRIEETELRQLRPDEVLIRLKACGICGSDVECFEGKSKEGRYDLGPYTPGHEWAGEIVDIGSSVSTLAAGNKVTGDCVLACGYCRNCKSGLMPSACLNMREVGFRPDSPGGMGEYLILEEKYVHRFPDGWAFEEGAWIENFSVGYFGIWGNGGCVDASDTVVITGAGPIGMSVLMVAKAATARTIVIDPIAPRRDIALRFGADSVLDPSTVDLKEEILTLTDREGASVVVEASGKDAAIASAFDIAGHSARIRFVGHSIGRKVPAELGLTIWKTLGITGAGGTRTFLPRTIRFMDRVRHRFDLSTLVSHRFHFTKLHDAFDVVVRRKSEAMKVMLHFD